MTLLWLLVLSTIGESVHDFFLTDETLKEVPVIGPEKLAATLEGSKEGAKEFIQDTISQQRNTRLYSRTTGEAYAFLATMDSYVLKADGLAAGKGVLIIEDIEEAKSALKTMLVDKKFGEASATVVIEEFLDGIELSCFVLMMEKLQDLTIRKGLPKNWRRGHGTKYGRYGCHIPSTIC